MKSYPRHIAFSIPEPCHVPWETMKKVDEQQRYCSSCEKTLTDFSQMSDDELMLYFRHSRGKICGRFARHQLDRPMKVLPERTVNAKWWRTLLLLPLTFFGKLVKGQNADSTQIQLTDSITHPVVVDSLKKDSTVAVNPVKADSVPRKSSHRKGKKEEQIAGPGCYL